MVKSSLYKYINLLFRLLIGVLAFIFIYIKLKDIFLESLHEITSNSINYALLITVIVLMILNWIIETIKWKYAIRNDVKIHLNQALQIVFTGVLAGLITPNRIGEIPARALMVSKEKFKTIFSKTMAVSYSQVLVTMVLGLISLSVINYHFNFRLSNELTLIIGLAISLTMLILYFNPKVLVKILYRVPYLKKNKIGIALLDFTQNDLFMLLIYSIFRYIIFSLQYYLILQAFGISLVGLHQLLLIPVCFIVSSVVPTILISEIGVRGSVAILVFGVVSNEHTYIVLASISLWVINVVIPALLGMKNINRFKLFKEK